MTKPNLLLLHGALGSSAQFEDLKNLLSDDFNVLTMNFTGHGGRALGFGAFSISLFTLDVVEFLRLQQIDKVSIFGYSMGGYVALNFARHYPEWVDKIMTLGTKFDWTPEQSNREAQMLDPEKMEEKVPHFASALSLRHAPQDWKQIVRRTADMMLQLGHGKALSLEAFRQIEQTILIGVGEADNMVSQEESNQVATTLPYGQLKIFPGFRHPIEQIDKVLLAREIRDFLLPN